MPYDPTADPADPWGGAARLAGAQLPPVTLFSDPSQYGGPPPGMGASVAAPQQQSGYDMNGGGGAQQIPGITGPDPQMANRMGLMNALAAMAQGGTVGGQGEPIPQEYMKQAANLRSLYQPGPAEQRFAQASAYTPPDVHGLKAHLAGIGKGLLMGGLGGAIYGGVDPSTVNRAFYRSHLPALAQASQIEEQQRQAQLKRAQELEGLTGIDPMTGLRGPTALNRDYMNALAFGRLGVAQDRAQTYKDITSARLQGIREKYANVPFENFIKAYNSGALNGDPDGLIAMAEKAGIPNAENIDPKFLPGAIKQVVDKNFGVGVLNLQTGEVKQTGVTSSEATKEAGRNARSEAGIKSREGIASANRAVSEQRLTDSEEKQIDKDARAKHKVSVFAPPEQQQANEAAIEQEKATMRAAKLAQRQKASGSANLHDQNIGRAVKSKDGKTGVIKARKADGTYDIDWR